MRGLIHSTILICSFIFMFVVGFVVLYEGYEGIKIQSTNSFVQILCGLVLTVFPVLGLISFLKDIRKSVK